MKIHKLAAFAASGILIFCLNASRLIAANDQPASATLSATTQALDPAVTAHVADLVVRRKKLYRHGSTAAIDHELIQIGAPAQQAVFTILLQNGLGNSSLVDYTVKEWNRQHLEVTDDFRPAAMQLVPQIVKANRYESVELLSLYGPLPELETAYAQLSLNISEKVADAAIDQLLKIDPGAKQALVVYQNAIASPGRTVRTNSLMHAMSRIGPAAEPVLLDLTRSSNIDDRVTAIRALGHYPPRDPAANSDQPLGTVQAVAPPVLARAAELLHDPTAGLTPANTGGRKYDGLICQETMDLLDTFGSQGRSVAIAALAGDNAAPLPLRRNILRCLGDAFPAMADLINGGTPTELQWPAIQTLATAINQDTPDRSFGLPIIGNRRVRTGDRTSILMNPVMDPPAKPSGEHTVAAALNLLSAGDAGDQMVAARVLSKAGQFSADQVTPLILALNGVSPDVSQKLSQAILTNADFSTSPEATTFVDAQLNAPTPQARDSAIESIAGSLKGRGFLADRLAAEPPPPLDVAQQVIKAISQHDRTGAHPQLIDLAHWPSKRYRVAIAQIFHRFDEHPDDALGETVELLQSADADTQQAAAAFLASPTLTGLFGPDTSDRVTNLLGLNSADLVSTKPASTAAPAAAALKKPASLAWVWNASLAAWALAALMMGGVSAVAVVTKTESQKREL